jgi:heptosyltransferase-1
VLIVRLSALGDVVLTSGLIPAVRALWPAAELSWLVEPAAAPLLAHNPRIDHLLVWPRGEWLQLLREHDYRAFLRKAMAFRRMLRDQRFDVVLDPQGMLKSGFWAWMTGAPRRVNLLPREGSQHLMHESVVPDASERDVISGEYRSLMRHLGAPAQAFQLDLAIGAAPAAAARAALQAAGINGPYAVLAAFTTRPQKHWIEARWAELAHGLIAQGLQPVLLGGPTDQPAAARITASNPAVVNLAGRLRLDETAAVVAGAALLVGVDTGLTHMGTALHIPTVALFGSTRPYLHGDQPTTRVLYDALPCAPCDRHPTCGGRFDCMQQFDVARVLDAARQVYMAASMPAG